MNYLGLNLQTLTEKGALHTAREITQQPELWLKVLEGVHQNKFSIDSFFKKALSNTKRIILTGAGTSAFIGLSLSGIFQRKTKTVTEAISTTDLVSHPKNYLHPDIPLLMISFARSGNSPESVAAVALADTLCNTCYHLIITCNSEGGLAKYGNTKSEHTLVFNLPNEANDQSLAMTSRYTGMLLAGIG